MDALPDTARIASDSNSASDEPPSLVDPDSDDVDLDSVDDEPPSPRPRAIIDLGSSSEDENPCDLPELTASQWRAVHDQADFKKLDDLAKKRAATLEAALLAAGCEDIAELWGCT